MSSWEVMPYPCAYRTVRCLSLLYYVAWVDGLCSWRAAVPKRTWPAYRTPAAATTATSVYTIENCKWFLKYKGCFLRDAAEGGFANQERVCAGQGLCEVSGFDLYDLRLATSGRAHNPPAITRACVPAISRRMHWATATAALALYDRALLLPCCRSTLVVSGGTCLRPTTYPALSYAAGGPSLATSGHALRQPPSKC